METIEYWDLFSIISLEIKESMEKYGIPMFPHFFCIYAKYKKIK